MAYLQTPVQSGKGRSGDPRSAKYKDGDLPLPELVAGDHLVGYLFQVGPAMATGQGGVPLSFGELQAWQQQTGRELLAWEVETLRRLSKDYVTETHKAASPAAKAPWTPNEEVRRKTVNDGLRALFKRLIVQQEARASSTQKRKRKTTQ
jgi:hypothetical protein